MVWNTLPILYLLLQMLHVNYPHLEALETFAQSPHVLYAASARTLRTFNHFALEAEHTSPILLANVMSIMPHRKEMAFGAFWCAN
jgi:hypothetical protein